MIRKEGFIYISQESFKKVILTYALKFEWRELKRKVFLFQTFFLLRFLKNPALF